MNTIEKMFLIVVSLFSFLLSGAFTVLISLALSDSAHWYLYVGMGVTFELAKYALLSRAHTLWPSHRLASLMCLTVSIALFLFSYFGTCLFFRDAANGRSENRVYDLESERERQKTLDDYDAAIRLYSEQADAERRTGQITKARLSAENAERWHENRMHYLNAHPKARPVATENPLGVVPYVAGALLEFAGCVCLSAFRIRPGSVSSDRIEVVPAGNDTLPARTDLSMSESQQNNQESPIDSSEPRIRVREIVISAQIPLTLKGVSRAACLSTQRTSEIMRELEAEGLLTRDQKNRYVRVVTERARTGST